MKSDLSMEKWTAVQILKLLVTKKQIYFPGISFLPNLILIIIFLVILIHIINKRNIFRIGICTWSCRLDHL